MIWYDMIWYMIWYDTWYDTTRHDSTRLDSTRNDATRHEHDTTRHETRHMTWDRDRTGHETWDETWHERRDTIFETWHDMAWHGRIICIETVGVTTNPSLLFILTTPPCVISANDIHTWDMQDPYMSIMYKHNINTFFGTCVEYDEKYQHVDNEENKWDIVVISSCDWTVVAHDMS